MDLNAFASGNLSPSETNLPGLGSGKNEENEPNPWKDRGY